MAAKMMEHINPCFEIMISKLPESLRGMVSRAKLIRLESIIVRTLDFNLLHDGPLPFLERYQRLLGVDEEDKCVRARGIGQQARHLCMQMQQAASFLNYRPSQ